MLVGFTDDLRYVRIQFTDPDWWADFTPAEARHLALLLLEKAEELNPCPTVTRHRGNVP